MGIKVVCGGRGWGKTKRMGEQAGIFVAEYMIISKNKYLGVDDGKIL